MFGFSLNHLDDAQLAQLIAKGNERAFAEVLKRYQDAVYGFALRMLNHPQEAEDAAQETFLRFFKTAARFRQESSLRTYLIRITKNICIDIFRKKKPELIDEIPEMPDTDTPLALLEGELTRKSIEDAVQSLPVNQRTAILLRHVENMSYNQIAKAMQLSCSAVESLLFRARQVLKQAVLQDHHA